MRARVFVAGALGAGVILSASGALAAPLSEEKWRKQGNAICKQVNRDLAEISQETFGDLGPSETPSGEQLAAYIAEFVPAAQEAVASIDALNEPKSVKKDLKKFKTAVAQAVKKLKALQTDPSAFDGNDPFAKVSKIAKKLGLKDCT